VSHLLSVVAIFCNVFWGVNFGGYINIGLAARKKIHRTATVIDLRLNYYTSLQKVGLMFTYLSTTKRSHAGKSAVISEFNYCSAFIIICCHVLKSYVTANDIEHDGYDGRK